MDGGGGMGRAMGQMVLALTVICGIAGAAIVGLLVWIF